MAGDRQVFRPAPTLRLIAGAMCLLSAGVWLLAFINSFHPSELPRAAAASVLMLPCIAGAAVLTRRIQVDPGGLLSQGIFGSRRLLWTDVRRVDVRRGTFVIESNVGPVTAALVDPRLRERLLRLIVEQARLTASMEELPWGIDARYIPRRQNIEFSDFMPHHRRKPSGPQ